MRPPELLTRGVRSLFGSRAIWAVLAFALVLLFNFLFTPDFFEIGVRKGRLYGSLVDILNNAAPTVLVSIGMTLIIATAGIDLSVGAVMAIAGVLAAGLVARPEFFALADLGLPTPAGVAILAALALSAFLGLINGALVAFVRLQPIVATLVLMVAGRGIAQLLADGQTVPFQNDTLAFLGSGSILWLPTPILIWLIAAIGVALLVRRTALGLFIESVGANAEASRLAGVRAGGILLLVYAMSGLLAGLGGTIQTANLAAADANRLGLYIELDAILAVVIGGTSLMGGRFFLLGAIFGALLIQSVTTTILSHGIPAEYTLVVKALIIIAVCLLQSEPARRALARRAWWRTTVTRSP